MVTVLELLRHPKFQELYTDQESWTAIPRGWPSHGEQIDGRWPKPRVFVPKPLFAKPTAYYYETAFAFESDAFESLKHILLASGEILEVTAEDDGRTLYVANVTQIVDCLDHERLTYYVPGGSSIKAYHFRSESVPPGLFRVPESPGHIFTATGLVPTENEFVSLVEAHGVTGIEFYPRWSETDG